MKKLLIATATLAILSPAAFAADAIIYEPVAQPAPERFVAYDWSGGYVGAHAGYGWGSAHDKNNPQAVKKEIDGGLVGIQAGYNWQFDNNLVLGVEGDVSFGSVNDKWRDDNQYSGYYTEDKVTALGTLRARLGYAADNFMPYVTGGLAIAKTKHVLGCDPALVRATAGSCLTDPNRVFHASKSDTSTGYALGFGGEYAVTKNWTFKAEYLYTDLGKSTVRLVDPRDPITNPVHNRKFDTSFSTVRVGVNYKF